MPRTSSSYRAATPTTLFAYALSSAAAGGTLVLPLNRSSTSAPVYRLLFKLVLERMDAEKAHRLAATVMRVGTHPEIVHSLLARLLAPKDPRLRVQALGFDAPSPLGVAAGMDKDATWFEGLGSLGFGFVEVGTVTAQSQAGYKQRPRVFRLGPDRALMNRMGFPNAGAAAVAGRLRRRRKRAIVGVNIGKTMIVPLEAAGADYASCTQQIAGQADYLVINVSSPNTPGLRDLQAVDHLTRLIKDVRGAFTPDAARVPLLIKIGPDLSDAEIDAVADLALALDIDGIVAVNTTVDSSCLRETHPEEVVGGISGAPLKARATEVLRQLRGRVGDRLVLISVGGIETPNDAFERIAAGATLVQAHTAFVYDGPLWPWRMNQGLSKILRDGGWSSIQDVVGTAHLIAEGQAATDAPSGHTSVSEAVAV